MRGVHDGLTTADPEYRPRSLSLRAMILLRFAIGIFALMLLAGALSYSSAETRSGPADATISHALD
jgi:hypothetical protein